MKFSKSYFDDIRYFDEAYKRALLILFIAVFFFVPSFLGTYFIFILSLIGVYTIVTVGLNILMGYAGQISLGHAAFMAIGAYSSTILISRVGLPFWLTLPSAGFITALVGSIAGIPALRLKGLYLAIVTMSFAFIIEEIIIGWPSLTQGSGGIFVPYAAFGSLEFDTDLRKFYLIWIVAILMLVFAKNIIRTRIGRAFIAIRDSDIAAETMGISLARYKIIAFGISAFYAGISGSLLAHLMGYIGPDNFTLLDSIAYLIMVIVGGSASILGSIMGAAFMTILPEAIRLIKDYLPPGFFAQKGIEAIIYGTTLIFFITFEPNGLYGRWQHLKAYWRTFPLGKKMQRKRMMVSGARRV